MRNWQHWQKNVGWDHSRFYKRAAKAASNLFSYSFCFLFNSSSPIPNERSRLSKTFWMFSFIYGDESYKDCSSKGRQRMKPAILSVIDVAVEPFQLNQIIFLNSDRRLMVQSTLLSTLFTPVNQIRFKPLFCNKQKKI